MKLGYISQEIELLEPDGFQIIPIRLGIKQRMASGKLIEEVVGVKNKFTIQYVTLEPELVNSLIEFYSSGEDLSFIYQDSGVEKNTIVNFSEFPRNLFVHDLMYSEDITLILEEV